MATWIVNLFEKKSATEKDTYLIPYSMIANTPTIPDVSGLMPKSGGAFTGNISVPETITFTGTTNPYIKMTTGGTDFYFQSASGQFGLGPTWNKATHWDSNGNVTFPTKPKVGSSPLALMSDIPDVSSKANLSGGNTFTGDQTIQDSQLSVIRDSSQGSGYIFDTYDSNVNANSGTILGVYQTGKDAGRVIIGDDSTAELTVGGNAGTSGQVLTSQGAGKTPQWTNPAIKSATLSGTTLTITL